MNQRIPKIAHLLRRWCAEQSGRTCEAMFTKFMADVLTKTEAKRFFDAYAAEPCLRFYSSRMCTIMVHQDHFNDDAVEEIAASINLSETIDARYGKPKAVTAKPSLPSRRQVASKRNLLEFSDEELYAELQRRDDERKAAERKAHVKELLDEFLATWEISKEELLEYCEIV